MGDYLNPGADLFRGAVASNIYVDKTELLAELNRVVGTEKRFVCVSRPRRFGKSMTANMLTAYYGRGEEKDDVFAQLKIAAHPEAARYRGKFDVIQLNMQEFVSMSSSVKELIALLTKLVVHDLQQAYPETEFILPDNLMISLRNAYAASKRKFVIVIDEWDCIFREYPHNIQEQQLYLDFLRLILKDKNYIALAYMTGILPIKKYGTHSALNMFSEYSMEHPDALAQYVGFTKDETYQLCQQYHMDFAECRSWYDGYTFPHCEHIYNPKSVVDAMENNRYGSYWNKTETYEALQIYINLNQDGLRDAIIKMMAGGRQKINTGTFQNDMTTFHSADDVMTLLVHLGYLGYDSEQEEVFIPNNEVMREYVNATEKGNEWQIVSQSIKNSDALL